MATPIHLDHISSLNNQGCDCLEQGNLSAAMSQFKIALTSLKGMLHADPKDEKDTSSALSARRTRLAQMPLHWLRSNVSSSGLSHIDGVINQNQFVIYSSAMRLFPGFCFSVDPIENSKIYTAFLVFNLALSLHLQGLSTCCRRSLQKAQSLYTHTYQLVDDIINEYFRQGRPTENASFDLLVLALLNNIALIHLEFADYGRAEAAFQSLIRYAKTSSSFEKRSTAAGASSFGDNCPEEQRQIQESYEMILAYVDSMLLNATVMGLNRMSAAAAA